ncbi:MAG: hypothetical protein CMD23_00580 [Flavobacteriales bacterium]|nr:hypothetical protein [Flavobacteriales bacterium]
MYFQDVLGNNSIKTILIKEVYSNKIPHAQLFNGAKEAGQLPMALAFVMFVFCTNRKKDDSCGRCPNCIKMLKLIHPDLHFFFPTKGAKSSSKDNFLEFQKMVQQNPYLNKDDWYQNHKINSSGGIKVRDAKIINKLINLKAYEGAYKVFILWLPETMNTITSNKLLKHLEEPSPNTLFVFITENSDTLLPTIVSRLQTKTFKQIETAEMLTYFQQKHPELEGDSIEKIIKESQNNYNGILRKISGQINEEETHNNFIDWMRLCFLAKTKKSIPDLILWCENMSKTDKNLQLEFLKISLQIIRHAFLLNYSTSIDLYPKIQHPNFNIKKFAKYLTKKNICQICRLLDNSHDYLIRYANSKILFLDLSFSLGKLLNK